MEAAMSKATLNKKKELEVCFITDLPEKFHLSQSNFNLPLEISAEKLNEFIGKLLKSKRNFCFFINNIKIDNTLEVFIGHNMISSEKVIEIYYMLEIDEPQHSNTIKEDEWIRSIQLLNTQKFIPSEREYAVGLFNGQVSFYNKSNIKLFSLPVKSDNDEVCSMLTSMRYFNMNNKSLLIKTMKYGNNSVELYEVDSKVRNEATLIYANKRNEEDHYYNCIDINPIDSDILCLGGSGSNNKGQLEIVKLPELTGVRDNKSNKKRKVDHQEMVPYYSFDTIHKNSVEQCCWLNKEQIITSGDDFNINVFNITSRNLFMTLSTNHKNATCLLQVSQYNFIAGYQDGMIKLYDIKSGNKSVAQFKDNKVFCDLVSDISLSNDKDNHPNMFITSHYDNLNKLWDLRGGSVPIHLIKTVSEKNYAVKFNGNNTILSGGDDSSINIYTL